MNFSCGYDRNNRESPNTVLHPWLPQELTAIIAALPPLDELPDAAENRAAWVRWQKGLSGRFTLLDALPQLRLLLIMDNIAGHKSASLVDWLMAHGIMPRYTPVSGSWLHRAESIQRILVGRALAGQHPTRPEPLSQWLEAVARSWNVAPTPFVWGGKRALRRQQVRERHSAGRYSPAEARACDAAVAAASAGRSLQNYFIRVVGIKS